MRLRVIRLFLAVAVAMAAACESNEPLPPAPPGNTAPPVTPGSRDASSNGDGNTGADGSPSDAQRADAGSLGGDAAPRE